ncbi:putative ABC-2 type transport system permease protein [Azorhizobium caulinodans ORS 571]|uniref:Putative ABC-2 type transport system permease protein n=1 Tax=Azorhizobium caulinodans (strain ATCC 43989 / DSM 5975 / JCM 20966 / LMG 6465 / NBRC 14845 / NCIMB 13405 / ORS 571) TaxID=438753 RepID=A8HW50_AZOC5|nr:ABC transporter permease [Azorhizobium caulinodans]BAF90390.1 putative ABC-2 type transport system permease protein [Azorhizobium caulinodans ORS 571]
MNFSALSALIRKELISLWRDRGMLILVLYAFTAAIYMQANGMKHDLNRATVGVVDEDNSTLSHAIIDALMPPRFQTPVALAPQDVDWLMDSARYTFVLNFPPKFQSDVLAGRSPSVQLLIDATALMQAGLGANYISEIFQQEVNRFLQREGNGAQTPVELHIRAAFNQTLESSWFTGTMGLINNITMLSVLLAGAALIREREHGTLEHVLVLPVRPVEIMMAKIIANGAVILLVTALSILGVLQGVMGMAIAGSIPLFLLGVAFYLFFSASFGIFLGTVSGSMPQLGLLFILTILPMNLLSGGFTPLESMPQWMQWATQLSPSTHFVAFAQAILYRGAGFEVVWPRFLAVLAIGGLFFAFSLARFRSFMASQQ